MAVEDFYWLTDNIWIKWRYNLDTLLLCVRSWKNLKKPPKILGIPLWTNTSLVHPFRDSISRFQKVPHSSVQTIVHKLKHPGNVHPAHRSGRRRGDEASQGRTYLGVKHARTKAKHLVGKRVYYSQGNKSCTNVRPPIQEEATIAKTT